MKWKLKPAMACKTAETVYTILYKPLAATLSDQNAGLISLPETNITNGVTMVNKANMASFETLVVHALAASTIAQLITSGDWLDETNGLANMKKAIEDKEAIDRKIKNVVATLQMQVGEFDPGFTKVAIKKIVSVIDKVRVQGVLEDLLETLEKIKDIKTNEA